MPKSKYSIGAVPIKHPPVPLHSWLPALHMLIVSPTGGGKSNLLVNMLYHKRDVFPYYKYFRRIHIFSPTAAELDPTWDIVKKDRRGKFLFHDDLDPEVVLSVLEQQDESIAIKGKKKTKHVLFVLDDLAYHMKSRNNDYMTGLVMKLRHSNVLCWITAQSYRSIPRQMRQQLLYTLLFRVSAEEMLTIRSELNGSFDERLFETMYNIATAEPYGFLYVDNRKQKFYASFSRELIPKRIEAPTTENAQIEQQPTKDETDNPSKPIPTPPSTKDTSNGVAAQRNR